jgi:hypothetical protein
MIKWAKNPSHATIRLRGANLLHQKEKQFEFAKLFYWRRFPLG